MQWMNSVILSPMTASKIGPLIPVVKISWVGRPHNFSWGIIGERGMGRMHTEQLITLTALEPHTCIALGTYST
jgi:hypothetical protein